MEKKKDRRMCRALSWILLALLVLIIVPIGALMFVISGLWSAADRALLRFNKTVKTENIGVSELRTEIQ